MNLTSLCVLSTSYRHTKSNHICRPTKEGPSKSNSWWKTTEYRRFTRSSCRLLDFDIFPTVRLVAPCRITEKNTATFLRLVDTRQGSSVFGRTTEVKGLFPPPQNNCAEYGTEQDKSNSTFQQPSCFGKGLGSPIWHRLCCDYRIQEHIIGRRSLGNVFGSGFSCVEPNTIATTVY